MFIFRMLNLRDLQYQTIRDWEGQIRKISQKEYVSSIGHGQYYPGEGVLTFQENLSDVAYFLGGSHHAKPAYWRMSDLMFKVQFKKVDETENFTVDSFTVISPSTSKTSEAPRLTFAAGLSLQATKSKLVGFSVNGKNLDLRSIEMSITNEIHVYETLSKNTTYRTQTYRTPTRAAQIPIQSKSKEILQVGDIPLPMYGSTLTLINRDGITSGEAVLVGGNSLVEDKPSPIEIMMGSKNVWEEKSNGLIYSLKFDLKTEVFEWENKEVQIPPRAHHSSMKSGNCLYVFGGVDYRTKRRYDIRPVIIDLDNWAIIMAVVPEEIQIFPLSGQAFCQAINYYFV